MKQRLKDICNITRYGNKITLTINNTIFTSPNFKEQQKALDNLKKDPELEITETYHRKLKLTPATTRTITIKMKQPTRRVTPLEKHHRFKTEPVKKPRYNWGARTYLRIKNHETMRRINTNKICNNRSKMFFP